MILVTGGAGFIGSNLVAALNEAGRHDLAVCDRLGRGEKWRNLAKRELAALIAPEELEGFLAAKSGEIETVFHLGAVSSTTEDDADLVLRANFALTMRLWDWCAAAGVPFLYASSAATYGDGEAGFDDDGSSAGLARLKPLNVYGWSKHLADRRIARLVESGAPRPPHWAGLKFFNVYGPNEGHKGEMMSLVAKLVPRLRRGEPARLFRSHRADYPDGGQRRDFVYVRDCVDMVLWLWRNERVNGLFNIGTGRARSFAELAAATCRALGREPAIEFIDTPEAIREKYQYFTEARMDRLRAAGYNGPVTSLEDGVADYVATYLTASDPYR
ncbi:MAG TPA: ADP-glyceromanno-heptose 6-epimerase [Stellaceae bacterium]|nr:ADP-glyceromanno-heptose 6-epimerase [Stellaceae bacterium]